MKLYIAYVGMIAVAIYSIVSDWALLALLVGFLLGTNVVIDLLEWERRRRV